MQSYEKLVPPVKTRVRFAKRSPPRFFLRSRGYCIHFLYHNERLLLAHPSPIPASSLSSLLMAVHARNRQIRTRTFSMMLSYYLHRMRRRACECVLHMRRHPLLSHMSFLHPLIVWCTRTRRCLFNCAAASTSSTSDFELYRLGFINAKGELPVFLLDICIQIDNTNYPNL